MATGREGYILFHKDLSLQEVRTLPSLDPPPQRRAPAEGGLLCGVASGAVEAYDFSTGRGLRTTRRVKAGDILLSVPLECCWSASAARKCSELSGISSLPDEDVLALHLLVERSRGSKGFNAEHTESIPKSFDMTSFWSESELAELEEDLRSTSRKLADQVADDFRKVIDALVEAGHPTLLSACGIDLEAFRWAKAVLWSRCCDLKSADGRLQRLLVPGFDLANHDPSVPVSHGIRDGQVYIRASRDQEAGEEVFINYGSHLNSHLVLWYGFVLDENPAEGTTLQFPVDASEADQMKRMGARLQDGAGDGRVFAQCTLSFREPLPASVVFAAALCNGICQAGQTELTPAQEEQALELLTKIVPARPPVFLPSPSDWRRRCAAVLQTADERIFAAFHAALQKRKLALARSTVKK